MVSQRPAQIYLAAAPESTRHSESGRVLGKNANIVKEIMNRTKTKIFLKKEPIRRDEGGTDSEENLEREVSIKPHTSEAPEAMELARAEIVNLVLSQ